MARVVFSSWGNNIIDNRGKKADDLPDIKDLNLPAEIDPSHTVAAFMGWNGVIVTDDNLPPVQVIDMARAYAQTASQVSCFRCTSCRIGAAVLAQILNRILDGQGEEADLSNLEYIGETMKRTSMCTLGETAAIPILDTLKYYRQPVIA